MYTALEISSVSHLGNLDLIDWINRILDFYIPSYQVTNKNQRLFLVIKLSL